MEDLTKAVEGEQPNSHASEPGKEKTNSLKNEDARVKNHLSKAAEILGKRTSSAKPAPTRSRARTSPALKKEVRGSKTELSGVTVKMNPPEIETLKEAESVGYVDSENEKNTNPKNSADENWTEWEEANLIPAETVWISESTEELETLRRKVEKEEHKVAKLKKKLKKAKKKDDKKSKIKQLKNKVIKATSKLKRRIKKLGKAS